MEVNRLIYFFSTSVFVKLKILLTNYAIQKIQKLMKLVIITLFDIKVLLLIIRIIKSHVNYTPSQKGLTKRGIKMIVLNQLGHTVAIDTIHRQMVIFYSQAHKIAHSAKIKNNVSSVT